MDSEHAAAEEPSPNFTYDDWLGIFSDDQIGDQGDGALTKAEIMDKKGWSLWKATKEIHRLMKSGRLIHVKTRREYCGVNQVVIGYKPARDIDNRGIDNPNTL